MRNTKSIFAAIIIAIFALTSCQKENISDLTQGITTTQNRTTPETNVVNKGVKTQFTEAMMRTTATSRSGDNELLTCGSGIVNGNTANSDNYFDAINALCLDQYQEELFNAPDKSYSFLVGDSPGESIRHSIILSKMQQDLDLFVYALDSGQRVNACVGKSITHGLDEEVLELGDLAPGVYLIVVDGWHKDVQSTFELNYYCSSSQEVPNFFAKTLVNKVIIGIEMGKKAGILQQISTTEWALKGIESDTTTAIMTETRRDNQNIYLEFDSGLEGFQIDLHNKKLLITSSETSMEYAHILDTSEEINGYLVNTITLGKDGQSIGKLHRQFDIVKNKEMWANGDNSFYTVSTDENNIFVSTSNGLGILQFDLVKMKNPQPI